MSAQLLGLQEFTDYFVKNYPGPDTIIGNPLWHAPRIYGAALFAAKQASHPGGFWRPIRSLQPTHMMSVILCVPSLHPGEPAIVGEATWLVDTDGSADWWWDRRGSADYYSSPLSETNAPPTHWMPLPAPYGATAGGASV